MSQRVNFLASIQKQNAAAPAAQPQAAEPKEPATTVEKPKGGKVPLLDISKIQKTKRPVAPTKTPQASNIGRDSASRQRLVKRTATIEDKEEDDTFLGPAPIQGDELLTPFRSLRRNSSSATTPTVASDGGFSSGSALSGHKGSATLNAFQQATPSSKSRRSSALFDSQQTQNGSPPGRVLPVPPARRSSVSVTASNSNHQHPTTQRASHRPTGGERAASLRSDTEPNDLRRSRSAYEQDDYNRRNSDHSIDERQMKRIKMESQEVAYAQAAERGSSFMEGSFIEAAHTPQHPAALPLSGFQTPQQTSQESEQFTQQPLVTSVASLFEDFEAYALSQQQKVEELREKWSKCTLQEWHDGRKEISAKFDQLLSMVCDGMTSKTQAFSKIDAQIASHQKTLQQRDESLKQEKQLLVQETGKVVTHPS